MAESTTLSAAIIARDAEDHIARTVESVGTIADEVVLVLDSRTADSTEAFARKAADRTNTRLVLQSRAWTHDFAAARNASLELCSGKWVLFLDADDELDTDDGQLLLDELCADDADLVSCHMFVDMTYQPTFHYDERFGDFCSRHWRNRVLRRSIGAQYAGRVHEQLEFPTADWTQKRVPVRFYHRGRYSGAKRDYYHALLQLDYQDDPTAPIPATYLAEKAAHDKDAAKAAQLLDRVNPDTIDAVSIAGRYWEVKGKICQMAWAMTIEAKRPDVRLVHTGLDYYERALEKDPDRYICYVNRTILCVFGLGPPGIERGKKILLELIDRDPDNVPAAEMLKLIEQSGTDHGELTERLKVYLSGKQEMERKAKLKADGWAPSVEVANEEHLSGILGNRPERGGGVPSKESRQQRRARERKEGPALPKTGKILKIGEY